MNQKEIYSNGIAIRDRRIIFENNFWKTMYLYISLSYFLIAYAFDFQKFKRKDLFTLLLYAISRNNSDIYSVMNHFDFIVFIKYLDIPSKVQEFEIKLQIDDSIKNWMKLIKLEVVVLIFAHVGCCIFLNIGQLEMSEGKPNWIAKFDYQNTPIEQLYLISLYYMIVSVCTIGYGDIYPSTICNIFYLIVNVQSFLYSFVFNQSIKHFQKQFRRNLFKKICSLKYFIIQQWISSNFIQSCKKQLKN